MFAQLFISNIDASAGRCTLDDPSATSQHQCLVSNRKPTERRYIAPGARNGAQTTSETLICSVRGAGINERGKPEEVAKLGSNADGLGRRANRPSTQKWITGSIWGCRTTRGDGMPRRAAVVAHGGDMSISDVNLAACPQSTMWAGGISEEEISRDCRKTRCVPLRYYTQDECKPLANGETI